MRQASQILTLVTRDRGFTEFTAEVRRRVVESGIRHRSAGHRSEVVLHILGE